MKNSRFLILLPAIFLALTAPVQAADVTVEVTNMTAGIYLTPLLVAYQAFRLSPNTHISFPVFALMAKGRRDALIP